MFATEKAAGGKALAIRRPLGITAGGGTRPPPFLPAQRAGRTCAGCPAAPIPCAGGVGRSDARARWGGALPERNVRARSSTRCRYPQRRHCAFLKARALPHFQLAGARDARLRLAFILRAGWLAALLCARETRPCSHAGAYAISGAICAERKIRLSTATLSSLGPCRAPRDVPRSGMRAMTNN